MEQPSATTTEPLVACHECDLIHRVRALPTGGKAACIRCGALLYQNKRNSLERSLAFVLAGLILFILANSFPFLALRIGSQIRQTTLITGIHELYLQHMQAVAILVFCTTILAPLFQMICLLYILLPLRLNRKPRQLPVVFRFVRSLQPWSMMEVFMVGILVSVVKLAKMAQIIPGIALFCFLALIFVMAAMAVSLDEHLIWHKWEAH